MDYTILLQAGGTTSVGFPAVHFAAERHCRSFVEYMERRSTGTEANGEMCGLSNHTSVVRSSEPNTESVRPREGVGLGIGIEKGAVRRLTARRSRGYM